MKRRWKGDDSGAALPLVLILVTVIAVVTGALLSFADTSVRTTVNLRDQAASAYTADGALQAAVNQIRTSTFTGAAGQHCFGASDTLNLPDSGGGAAAVSCTADPAKVLIQCPSLSVCNRPGSAILTLGTGGEDGLNIQQPTGSSFKVHGVVYSNSNINVVNGSLDTNTAVYARGACSGTIRSTPAASCGYGGSSLGADPGYAPALTSVPPRQNLPACTKSGSLVTFQPGYYDDAAGLSAMMSSSSKCKDSTFWFTPGAYYFDFHNSAAARPPSLPGGDDVWTVDNGFLVAGTPVDGSGRTIAKPAVPANIPGACDNPIDDAKAVGVQFVFGGDSRLAVKAGQVEICGTYSADHPPVAVHGLTSGTESPVTAALTPSGTPTGTFTTAPAGSLSTVDGNLATWTANGNGNQSATVTATGYAPATAIPAGSLLTSARVRVVHGNDNGSSQDNLSVQLGTDKFTVPAYPDKVLHTDLVDVSTPALAQQVYDGTFTGAQLSYTAALKHKGTEQVDALRLELGYTPPALRAESGCTQLPYTTSAACALLTSVNNSGNRFYVQGTTYAPKAALDITLNNATEPIFRFGVIARSLWVKETGSVTFTGAVIEVPDDSPGFVFGVYLSAYVCPGAGPCALVGTPAARARVAYVDGDPTNPVAGARQVSVLSWSGNR
ncbi:hypothetical protein [Amycolatopsis vastitatis]|uniref:Uncharacterized protein n=1 Tax=Amycolatopsis vastitatis TaxID=1905142 RepID=A0A229TD55_9PSEU|nr:hypothetical protein [Amycolatopsis vastitatis]OXM69167.1 hypothetical protein CF165_10780 [Amycolatopsis vastitatis]